MKILFQAYNTICQNCSGGMNVRIHKIKSKLEENGYEVDFFDPFTTDISQYDIVHVFMLTYEVLPFIQCAKKFKKKVIISSTVPTIDGFKIDISVFVTNLHILTARGIMAKAAQEADCVITETKKEADFLHRHYGVKRERLLTIPSGIDCFDDCNDDFIYEKLNKKCKYILQVGRFDENKNQINIIKALKNTGIDIVFIGGSDHGDDRYYNKCLREAEGYKNMHFLGWIPNGSDLLISAYKNADVVVVPSFYETFGLVIVEAGILGAKLALSETLPILEYPEFNSCCKFSPKNVNDIRRKLTEAFNDSPDFELKKRIEKTFSWDAVVRKHIECYREILR